jgi:chromosome segregation ATPase
VALSEDAANGDLRRALDEADEEIGELKAQLARVEARLVIAEKERDGALQRLAQTNDDLLDVYGELERVSRKLGRIRNSQLPPVVPR